MLAPRISFVEHKTPGDNEFLGKVECYPIQFHRHDALSYASSALFDFLHSR
jgi:hypothetical protein